VTVGSAVAGFALAVSLVGGVATSEAEPVGSLSGGELSVGAGLDALGVGADALVPGDPGCVTEGDASGCAGALAEADGEVEGEADGEVLASGDELFLPGRGGAAGLTTFCRLLGWGGVGVAYSFCRGVFVGAGSLFRMPGFTESGMTPASLATQRPPMNRPKAKQSTRTLPANSPLTSPELVKG